LGLGWAFFKPVRPLAWVLIPGFILGVSANALSMLGIPADADYVHSNRFSILIPFLFLAAAWGIEWLLKYVRVFSAKKIKGPWAAALLGIACLGPAGLNEPLFLPPFHDSVGSWGEHGFHHLTIAQILLDKAPTCHLMVDSDSLSAVVYFIVHDKAVIKNLYPATDIPVRYQVSKNVLMVFAPWRMTEDQKAQLRHFYPEAVWKEYRTPGNVVFLNSVEIPLKEVLDAQKDRPLMTPLS